MGNGVANVIAALIVAAAILVADNFSFGGRQDAVTTPADEEAFAEWYARAVGDIRNDIVVNCGCCGEGPQKPGF
jgi:hypothetical protein